MEKKILYLAILWILFLNLSLPLANSPRGSAFGGDHDCCMVPKPKPKPPKPALGMHFQGVVKEFDSERDLIKIEIAETKTIATFDLDDHLKQKQNEYRKLFKSGRKISAKWDDTRKAYRISE